MENEMKKLKQKIKNELKKEKENNKRQMQELKVRFPSHTTNVYHSTFIQPSTVLLSPQTPYPSSNK
jgi:lantibiotic modifying enzyme